MTAELNGRNFRALFRLSNIDDDTLADIGERCDKVPTSSLPLLLEARRIEPIGSPDDAKPPQAAMTEAEWSDLGRPLDDTNQSANEKQDPAPVEPVTEVAPVEPVSDAAAGEPVTELTSDADVHQQAPEEKEPA